MLDTSDVSIVKLEKPMARLSAVVGRHFGRSVLESVLA